MYQACGIWEINVFVVSGFVTGGYGDNGVAGKRGSK